MSEEGKVTVCRNEQPRFCLQLWKPRPYQEEAVERWLEKGKFGAIKLPTGAGKTLVALWAWAKLNFPKMVIVVPTNALKQSHIHELEEFGLPDYLITTDPRSRDGWVAIVTYQLLTMKPEVLNLLIRKGYRFFVFDEVHHTSAEKFFERVFSRIAENLKGKVYVLGLSATPKGSGIYSEKVSQFLPVVYARSVHQLKEYLAPIYLYLVATPLSPAMQEEYDEIQTRYQKILREIKCRYSDCYHMPPFSVLQRNMDNQLVREFFKLFNEKKRILNSVANKDRAVAEILSLFPNEKAMLFAERQDQLIKLLHALKQDYGIKGIPFVNKVVKNKKIEKEILDAFREGKIRVLGIIKKGEEGVNFPEVSIGIIISTPKNERAIVQRVGRIVRPRPGKIARIFLLYVPGTEEERLTEQFVRLLHPDKVFRVTMSQLLRGQLGEEEVEKDHSAEAYRHIERFRKILAEEVAGEKEELEKLMAKAKEMSRRYGIAGWSMYSADIKRLRENMEKNLKLLKASKYILQYLSGELSKDDLMRKYAELGVTAEDVDRIAGPYAPLVPKPIKLLRGSRTKQMRWGVGQ